jgi:hypothetical protein
MFRCHLTDSPKKINAHFPKQKVSAHELPAWLFLFGSPTIRGGFVTLRPRVAPGLPLSENQYDLISKCTPYARIPIFGQPDGDRGYYICVFLRLTALLFLARYLLIVRLIPVHHSGVSKHVSQRSKHLTIFAPPQVRSDNFRTLKSLTCHGIRSKLLIPPGA